MCARVRVCACVCVCSVYVLWRCFCVSACLCQCVPSCHGRCIRATVGAFVRVVVVCARLCLFFFSLLVCERLCECVSVCSRMCVKDACVCMTVRASVCFFEDTPESGQSLSFDWRSKGSPLLPLLFSHFVFFSWLQFFVGTIRSDVPGFLPVFSIPEVLIKKGQKKKKKKIDKEGWRKKG